MDAVKDGHFQPLDPNIREWKSMDDRRWTAFGTGMRRRTAALKKVIAEINKNFFKK